MHSTQNHNGDDGTDPSTTTGTVQRRRLVGRYIEGRAHCKGWNGINGTISHNSIPAITMSLSSYVSAHHPSLLYKRPNSVTEYDSGILYYNSVFA